MTTTEFTRVNNDVNGNPRYVCHYSNLITQQDEEKAKELSKVCRPFKFFVEYEYDIALAKAKKIGGRKFHNKQYGGGIVFQSYNLDNLTNLINNL
mgnify:CR=1 FL=1